MRALSIKTGVELLSRPTNFAVNKSKSNAPLSSADEGGGGCIRRTSGTSGCAEITALNFESQRLCLSVVAAAAAVRGNTHSSLKDDSE